MKNHAEHEAHVKTVLQKFKEFGLYCKGSKCEFSVPRVNFLGFIVSESGIEMETGKIQSIEEWPTPESVREVQILLRFTNFYRRFNKRKQVALPLPEFYVNLMVLESQSTSSRIKDLLSHLSLGNAAAELDNGAVSSRIHQLRTEPLPVISSDDPDSAEWEVERIINSRVRGRGRTRWIEYLVQWAGYAYICTTWEPAENLVNCDELITEFHDANPDKPRSRTAR